MAENTHSSKSSKRSRQGRVWSANSKYFHSKACSAVDRITKVNLRSGTAPPGKVPHSCIKNTDTTHEGMSDVASSSNAAVNTLSLGLSSQSTNHSTNLGRSQNIAREQLSSRPLHGSGHSGHKKTPKKQKKPLHLNPYCQCDPCECASPCTCGLRKRESTSQVTWDADNYLLKHTVTDIYRPESRNNAAFDLADQHTTTELERPVKTINARVATADEALTELNSTTGTQQTFLEKYQLADEFAEHHGANAVSVRTTNHKGYDIEIRTHYEITIDGEPLDVHIQVSPDGKVHCHSIPNYESSSTVDLIQTIVDTFRDDFPPKS